MTLNEKYRMHRSLKIGNYIKLLCVIVFIVSISFTFSAYNNIIVVKDDYDVAKFSVKVNGQSIENLDEDTEEEGSKLISDIKLITTNGPDDDIIRAGEEGYFDIEIDPTGTEVALEYFITLDFSSMPEVIKMKSYSLNGVDKGELPSDYKFSGEMNLHKGDANEALVSSDKVSYRIYWQWKGDVSETGYEEIEMQDYKLKANVIVQQKISES